MQSAAAVAAPKYDEGKFRELFLYVHARLAGDPSNGSLKSNKVLFFSDFIHYAAFGRPITGVPYIHRQFGPAPSGAKRVQKDLIESDDADLVVIGSGPAYQKMLFPKRKPDLSEFTPEEISTVNMVLEALKDHTGHEASDFSHAWLAWKLTRMGEEIPYSWGLMYDGPVPDETFTFAEGLVQEIREQAGAAA